MPPAGIATQSETRLFPQSMSGRPVVAPLSPARYLIKVTMSDETHDKFERARALLRHVIPNGDPAEILDRALTLLVDRLERTKTAKARRPRTTPTPTARPVSPLSRHVPAAVRRAVWARDEGRCTFIGSHGRCTETGRLEFHHLIPYARGGPTSVANLAVRCRAHNAFEGEREFGMRGHPTRSGPSEAIGV